MRRGPNISPEDRHRIIAKREEGMLVRELAREFSRSESAIKYTIRTYTNANTTEERYRSGRPNILSRYQKKLIYRKARATPKIEYSELAKVSTLVNPDGLPSKPPSHSTLYRVLKGLGLTKYRAKKHPKLTRGHALARLRFCRTWTNFPWHRRTIKFSDKCTIEKGIGQNQEWVFSYPWETWNINMIQTYGTGKRPSKWYGRVYS
jgi:transposase